MVENLFIIIANGGNSGNQNDKSGLDGEMMGVNLRDIDKLSLREHQQFERWQRDYLNKQYYRNLRERAIAQQRAEQEIEDDSTRDIE